MAPQDPWHRRYWRTYNRPYNGCGCLWALLIIFLIWWIIGWAWGGWGWGPNGWRW